MKVILIVAYFILGLLLYHSMFNIWYFNFGRAIMKEIFGGVIFAVIMASITLVYWLPSMIIIILIGLALSSKCQDPKIKIAVKAVVVILGISVGLCGRNFNKEQAEKKAKIEGSVGETNSSSQNLVDSMNTTQTSKEYILSVKNGYPIDYPQCTYGDAFEAFFEEPTWSYFEADSGENVVEFTGYCLYQDTKVQARLQFIMDETEDTFSVGSLTFNDVPQTDIVTSSLVEKVFEEFISAQGIGNDDQEIAFAEETSENSTTEEYANMLENDEYSKNAIVPHVILANSSSEALRDEDISNLTSSELRYAKNEIYARHGRKFKDLELQAWFDAQEWYQGTIEPEQFHEDILSEIEKNNILVIQDRIEANNK